MMGNSQHLHSPINFAVDDIKVKNLKHSPTNVRCMDDPRCFWVCTYPRNCLEKLGVIASPQPYLRVLIVCNLSGVLFGCGGV